MTQHLLSSFLCVVLCTVSTNGFNLNKNGGYDLLIAVQEDTKSPPDPSVYFGNIEKIVQSWSTAMWNITDKKFFINSIQFVVPDHWQLSVIPATTTTQSYKLADIRISENFKYLRVENPNGCGLAGHFVEVPSEFFDAPAEDGPFGTPWKALITQWARYRYGIWEEHGYPGDEVYPYFYQKPGQKVGWLTTGCSNSELHGKYLTIGNETCDASGPEYPGDDCRFVPDSELTEASTSLMHFHWIKSVNHFCDETTHDRESPNRQNRLCGHRSAWEVIRESSDYRFVTEAPSEIPQLTVQIFKASLHPRLSILLDRGNTPVSSAIVQNVVGVQLGKLFVQDIAFSQLVAQISSFPPDDVSPSLIQTDVEWATISDNLPFIKALTNVTTDGPETRDFASAVQAAVDELVDKNNPAGSILIVVKTGSNEGNFGNIPFEQDLKIILQENPRIKFYAIELLENEQSSSHHLQGVAQVSGGKHVTILNQNDIQTKLAPLIVEISDIWTTVKDDPEPEQNNFRGVYRGSLVPNEVNEVPILTSNLQELEFHLTTTQKIPLEQLYVRPLVAGHYKTTFPSLVTIGPEWNEELDATRRFTYSLKTTSQIRENSKWIIQYECDSSVANCDGIVHVYGKINEIQEEREEEEEEEADPEIEIVLSTSSKIIDFTNKGFSNSPLIIFASVHRQGQPVIDLDVSVTVSKVHSINNSTWVLELRDDGHGNPDISTNDGIYSASFIPSGDGNYQMNAFVKNRDCSTNDENNDNNDPELRLLLPDQKNIGCYPNNNKNSLDAAHSACTGFKIVGTFGRIVYSSDVFQVQNSDSFKAGQPYRILDFQGSGDAISGLITFTFTSPALIASFDEGARSYSIYHSENIEDLIGDVGEGVQRLGNYSASSPSGKLELIRATSPTNQLRYYAIETNYGTIRSGPSNIIAVTIHPEDMTTTTTPKDSSTTSTFTMTSGSTTQRHTITTTKPITSTPPDDSDDPEGPSSSSSFWSQPKAIAALTVGSITLITVLTFILVQYVRRRLANRSTNVV